MKKQAKLMLVHQADAIHTDSSVRYADDIIHFEACESPVVFLEAMPMMPRKYVNDKDLHSGTKGCL